MENEELDLEKKKLWFNIAKFLIGTVALSVLTLVVNTQIKNKELDLERIAKSRELEIKRIEQDNKFLAGFTEHIVDKDPQRKRDIAFFLSKVSWSEETRGLWADYHTAIEKIVEEEKSKTVLLVLKEKEKAELESEIVGLDFSVQSFSLTNPREEKKKKLETLNKDIIMLQVELNSLRSQSMLQLAPIPQEVHPRAFDIAGGEEPPTDLPINPEAMEGNPTRRQDG